MCFHVKFGSSATKGLVYQCCSTWYLNLYLRTDFHVLVLVLVVLYLKVKYLYLYLYLKLKYLYWYWYWYLRLCTFRHAKDHSESVTIYHQRNVCQR